MTEAELAPFLQHAKASKVGMIVVALVCFGIGALGFADKTATLGTQLGLAIPFALLGLFLLSRAFRPPEKHPVIVALRDRPNDVVWVYSMRHIVNGVHGQTLLQICLANGKRRQLAIGAATDPEPLLRALQAPLGHATFGFSKSLDALYKKAPSSLRRA
jgi:hypothetical protein